MHAVVKFNHWQPTFDVSKPSRKETYGKSLIAHHDGSWTIAEIALSRAFQEDGWHAGWFDTFGAAPQHMANWTVKIDFLPQNIRYVMETIDRGVQEKGGRPDIIAWRRDSFADAVFVEYKGPKDSIRPSQVKWFQQALLAGMSKDQFAVVTWPRHLA